MIISPSMRCLEKYWFSGKFVEKEIMTGSTLDKKITDYLPLLGDEEKMSLIGVIKSFIHLKKTGANTSMEQYNNELAEAEAEFQRGDYITHDQLKAKAKEWIPRSTK